MHISAYDSSTVCWRREWDSDSPPSLGISKLQIPQCHGCRECQRRRRRWHAVARCAPRVLTPGGTVRRDSGRIHRSRGSHDARLCRARGAANNHVRAGRSHIHRPVRDRPRPSRDVPRPRRVAARPRGPPALCRTGVSRLHPVRMSGRWLCAFSVRGLRTRSAGRLLVQGSGLLSHVRRSPAFR
jgi:hypothetical protein